MSDFKDKNILVTGASKGIGRAIAVAFAAKGANVAINYNTDEKGAVETKNEVDRYNNNSLIIKADVSISKEVTEMFKAFFKKYNKIDVLVNNAGIAMWKPFLEIDESNWDKTIDVNLKGVFLCSQISAKNMVENKVSGAIVNISSQGAYAALDCLVPYCAAKGGVTLITKSIAYELAPFKIRVNAVAPGTVAVERNFETDPNFPKNWEPFIPLGRVGETHEIANTVLFLASDEASYITGQTLFVDGGGLSYISMPKSDFAR